MTTCIYPQEIKCIFFILKGIIMIYFSFSKIKVILCITAVELSKFTLNNLRYMRPFRFLYIFKEIKRWV